MAEDSEWSLDWDVVGEKLQGILEELKLEGKAEVDEDTEAAVTARLVAALAPPPTVILSMQYVTVNISGGSVKAKTLFTGTKHFEGRINKTHWGGSSSGWFTIQESGDVSFTALNTDGKGRGGNFQMRFYKDNKQVAHFAGGELYMNTEGSGGQGTLWK